MTSFTYNNAVPAAANNPSVDQSSMLTNAQSIQSIIAVDHVTFNSTGPAGASGGQHLQVSFNGKNVPGGAPTDPLSIMYTNSGTASSISQVFFRNQNAIYQISAIKAWGLSDNTGAIIATQSVNVSGIVKGGTGVFHVTLTANAISSSNFFVNISYQSTTLLVPRYSLTGIGTFDITFNLLNTNPGDPTNFSFQVLQL